MQAEKLYKITAFGIDDSGRGQDTPTWCAVVADTSLEDAKRRIPAYCEIESAKIQEIGTAAPGVNVGVLLSEYGW
jgi:hypothetical protein